MPKSISFTLAVGIDVNVLRLDIAMHDGPAVHVVQGIGDVQRDAQAVIHSAQAAVADGLAQVFALQVLHHDERLAVEFAVIEHADDILVLEASGQLGFLQEPGLGFGILTGAIGQDLHHHGAVDHRIAGPIHVRHTAAQEFEQLVFSEGRGKFHGLAMRLAISRPPA